MNKFCISGEKQRGEGSYFLKEKILEKLC